MRNHCVKKILKVLIYIEAHIDEVLTLNELAEVACYSPFHFHRVFQWVVGESVYQYVRRLRLERSAVQLRHTNRSVTDIAFDSNFDTSSSFTKAFKQFLGETPRNYRLLYQEVEKMKNCIESLQPIHPENIMVLKPMNVVFIRAIGDYNVSSNIAWDAMMDFIHAAPLDESTLRYFSIVHDDPEITASEKLRFDACISAAYPIKLTHDMGQQTLAGGKYAMFVHRGSHETIGDTFDQIYLKWLPESHETVDPLRLNFCEHFHLDQSDETQFVTHLFIPLK